MSDSLNKTFELLTKVRNDAAVPLLIGALESSYEKIRSGALSALLERRNQQGHREILSRLQDFDKTSRSLIDQRAERLSHAIRDGILGDDPVLCENGYLATLWFKDYDQIPTLITAAEDPNYEHADRAAETLLKLTELLYDALTHSAESSYQRNPLVIRKYATSALAESVSRFAKHGRREMLVAFCILAKRENSILKRILQSPFDKAFLPLLEILNTDFHAGTVELILSFLDDPKAPASVLNVLAHRSDAMIMRLLMKKIGYEPSIVAKTNLKQMTSIPWALDNQSVLDELGSDQQFSAMQMVNASGMKRLEVFQVIEYLMLHGKPGGRRAASAVLAEFSGGNANKLCEKALADEDPQVKANAVAQIRKRGIPNALSTLIEMIDSPHLQVQRAARGSLSEYSFKRYLAAFETMEDDARRSAGLLVKKIDTDTISLIIEDLKNPARSRRLRVLEIAEVIEVIPEMESTLIAQLSDEDHIIRAECARLLVKCNTPETIAALRNLLWDTSVIVQEAAERSLDELAKQEKHDDLASTNSSQQKASTSSPAPAAARSKEQS